MAASKKTKPDYKVPCQSYQSSSNPPSRRFFSLEYHMEAAYVNVSSRRIGVAAAEAPALAALEEMNAAFKVNYASVEAVTQSQPFITCAPSFACLL